MQVKRIAAVLLALLALAAAGPVAALADPGGGPGPSRASG